MVNRIIVSCLLAAAFAAFFLSINNIHSVDGFIVFLGNTTACDFCDEYQTYSGRNVLCCLAQSKCCGPNNFDDINKRPWGIAAVEWMMDGWTVHGVTHDGHLFGSERKKGRDAGLTTSSHFSFHDFDKLILSISIFLYFHLCNENSHIKVWKCMYPIRIVPWENEKWVTRFGIVVVRERQ